MTHEHDQWGEYARALIERHEATPERMEQLAGEVLSPDAQRAVQAVTRLWRRSQFRKPKFGGIDYAQGDARQEEREETES